MLAVEPLQLLADELSVALTSRRPTHEVLRAQADASRGRRRHAFAELAARLESGARLSEAAGASRLFPGEFVALVSAGERGGNLPEVLWTYRNELERRAERSGKLRTQLVYPTVVVAMLLLACLVLAGLHSAFLPVVSSPLSALAFAATGLLLPLAALRMGVLVWRGLRPIAPRSVPRLLPSLERLALEEVRARTFRTLSFLLKGRVPLAEALRLTAGGTSQAAVTRELTWAAERVEAGGRFGDGEGWLLTPAERAVLSVRSGALSEVLEWMAEAAEVAAEREASDLAARSELWLTLLLGLLVGLFVVSTYSIYFRSLGGGFPF